MSDVNTHGGDGGGHSFYTLLFIVGCVQNLSY